jgi:ribosomal-protein-alanine N-acetyltransferase
VINEQATKLEIRPMGVKDVDQIIQIEKQAFPTPWTKRTYMAELLDNDRAYYFVARLHGRVVGYIGMWLIAGEGHITNLAVHPQFRRRGVGWELLRALADFARSRGAESLTLEVRVSNSEAQRLYTKFGFIKSGIRRGYYLDNGEDALIMWKDLTKEEEHDRRISTGPGEQLR